MEKKKIALVTGGSRGLGKDMALALSQKGTDIILTYNTRAEEAEKVAAAIRAMGNKAAVLQFNVGDLASFNTFREQLEAELKKTWDTGKFDFLINNAGIGATIPIADVTEEKFDEIINIQFKGVYFLTQRSLPLMNDNGGVVFISSGSTRFNVPGYSVYASSKGAIEVFARYVAKEYGPRGIRSNVIAPGAIETDFNGALIRNNPRTKAFIVGQTALGRIGMADDIGGVVAFLCSDEARWINGQRIEVSGGINL
jgi:NAD(P)-dependent dehydrogenase (short-subunit alcohol dehydrogenase family)